MKVSREQVVRRLLDDGYEFQDQRPRVMMYRRPGRQTRVMVPRRDYLDEREVRTVLAQAHLTPAQVESFLTGCIKH